VEQLRTTLAPVSGAIQSVRALVDFINAIPFISETPPAVEELESALNRLDEAAANARQVGDTIRTTVVEGSSQMTQQTVDLLTSLTSGVDNWLAEAQSAVDTLQTEMAALQERLALLRSQLLLIYSLAAVGATLLMLWLIYSQVVVIRHQWQLLRSGGHAAVEAPAPAAPITAPSAAAAVEPAPAPEAPQDNAPREE
jgi:hypothetical protein